MDPEGPVRRAVLHRVHNGCCRGLGPRWVGVSYRHQDVHHHEPHSSSGGELFGRLQLLLIIAFHISSRAPPKPGREVLRPPPACLRPRTKEAQSGGYGGLYFCASAQHPLRPGAKKPPGVYPGGLMSPLWRDTSMRIQSHGMEGTSFLITREVFCPRGIHADRSAWTASPLPRNRCKCLSARVPYSRRTQSSA